MSGGPPAIACTTTTPDHSSRRSLRFLRAHPGQVDPITVSLGGNDIDDFLATCTPGDLACIQPGPRPRSRASPPAAGAGLRQLRHAAPRARIVVVGLYDPNVDALDVADPLFAQVNAACRLSARRRGPSSPM